MAFPVIAWRTLLRNSGAVITASSTASGFSATNVKDWRSFTFWKAGSATSPQYIDIDLGGAGSTDADSLVVVNHNMVAEGGNLKVYADAVTPGTTQVQASYAPSSDITEFKAFAAAGAKRYWRVEFNKGSPFTNAPYAAVIMLGLKMTMPEYIAPNVDPYLHDIEAIGNRTDGGHVAGVVLRGVPRRATLHFGGDAGLLRSFITSDFNPFLIQRYRRYEPWVFQLDSADSEFSPARYLKRPNGGMAGWAPIGGTYARMKCDLPAEEALMEAA
jgi:hypothetical protein